MSVNYNIFQMKMVGIAGLEPATSRPPDARATRLRYIPIAQYNSALYF